jgi:hypothetical protein
MIAAVVNPIVAMIEISIHASMKLIVRKGKEMSIHASIT